MAQMKEQIKTPEKIAKWNGDKQSICSEPWDKFKTSVIRMFKELSENLSSIKKIQSETKDALTEIKNNLQGKNNIVDEAENQINDLEHKEAKNDYAEWQEEKRIQKNEHSISRLWNNFKWSNVLI